MSSRSSNSRQQPASHQVGHQPLQRHSHACFNPGAQQAALTTLHTSHHMTSRAQHVTCLLLLLCGSHFAGGAYLNYVSLLNQAVMMSTQLYNDATNPAHHKYAAHQVALLYVSAHASTGTSGLWSMQQRRICAEDMSAGAGAGIAAGAKVVFVLQLLHLHAGGVLPLWVLLLLLRSACLRTSSVSGLLSCGVCLCLPLLAAAITQHAAGRDEAHPEAHRSSL